MSVRASLPEVSTQELTQIVQDFVNFDSHFRLFWELGASQSLPEAPLAFPEASQPSFGTPERAQGVLQEGLGEDFGEIWDSFGDPWANFLKRFSIHFWSMFLRRLQNQYLGGCCNDFGVLFRYLFV